MEPTVAVFDDLPASVRSTVLDLESRVAAGPAVAGGLIPVTAAVAEQDTTTDFHLPGQHRQDDHAGGTGVDGNALGIPDIPGVIRVTASGFIGDGRGVGYVDEEERGERSFIVTVGERDRVAHQLDPSEPFKPGEDEDVAAFDEESAPKFRRKLTAAAKAADAGKAYGPSRVRGVDLGDVQVAVDGDKVRVSVLPYGVEEPYPERFDPDPLTEVYDDDTDEARPPTAAEVAENLADRRAEYEAEVAEYNKALAERRERLTVALTVDEARELAAALDVRPPEPSGGLVPVTAAADRYVRDGEGKFAEQAGPSLKDVLKLVGKIDLAPGETLAGSAKVEGDSGGVKLAVVDRADGTRSVRLGVGGEMFTDPDNDVPWRAGPDESEAVNAERRQTKAEHRAVETELERLDADPGADPARKAALEARYAELDQMPWDDVYAGGYTAGLDVGQTQQLRDAVAEALARGAEDSKRINAEWDAWEVEEAKVKALHQELNDFEDEAFKGKSGDEVMDPEDAERAQELFDRNRAAQAALDASKPDFDYTVYAEGVVSGEWADVHFRVEVDEPDSGVQTILAAVPHDMDYDDLGDDRAQFDEKETGQFLRLLDKATGVKGSTVSEPEGGLVPVVAAFDETKIKRDNEGQFAEKVGSLADIADDVTVDGLDGVTVYAGIREDGTVDLGIGTDDDDPVARFSRHDVDAISDEAYRLWRLRDDDPADAEEVFGLIDDGIVDTEGQRIYLAISQGQTYTADPDDPDDEDGYGPILTVGIPTANDSEDAPDFHEVQLDDDGFDALFSNLERFRDDYEPAEVDGALVGEDVAVQLMADHTVRVSVDGDDDPAEMSIFEASALAEAIERLQGVALPDADSFDPDDPDTVDGEDVSDDTGVSLNEDGTLTLNLTTGSRHGAFITVEPEDIAALAENLRLFVDKDTEARGAASPVTAAGSSATGEGNHMVQPTQVVHGDWCRNPLHPGPCAKPGSRRYKQRHGGGPSTSAKDGKSSKGKPFTEQEMLARQQRVEAVIGTARKTLATDLTHAKDGAWTPERDRIHRKIAADLYAAAANVPTDGKAVIAGGLGGAGKSTVLRDHAGVNAKEFLTLNPDDVKEEMARRGLVPEVPDAPDLSPMERAALIHEESSRITRLVADMAYRDRRNVIWDVTMSSEASTRSRIEALRRNGYSDIRGVFVDIPVEVSVDRALTRYRRGVNKWAQGDGLGGRFVPPSIIRAQETSRGRTVNREVFDHLRAVFDDWSVYDNSVDGRAPELVDASRGLLTAAADRKEPPMPAGRTVATILDDLAAGLVTTEEVAADFIERTWPDPPRRSDAEVWGVADDAEPDPDSWAAVSADSRLSADQYGALADAYRQARESGVGPAGEPLIAAAEVHTGAMVALVPSAADIERLAVDGGEPGSELHCTLLYLGDAADIPPEGQRVVIDRITRLVNEVLNPDLDGPLTADGFAVNTFNPPGVVSDDGRQRDACVVLGLSGDDLAAVHDLVCDVIDEVDAVDDGWQLPAQHEPWNAHVTLAYGAGLGGPALAMLAGSLFDRVGPITFDRIRVAFAGTITDIPLTGTESQTGLVLASPIEARV